MQIARTILNQLGGNRFAAFTGAKNFGALENGLSFKIGRNAASISHVTITLNGLDLYDIKYIRVRGTKITTVHEAHDVYCDMLQAQFTETTGLDTHF